MRSNQINPEPSGQQTESKKSGNQLLKIVFGLAVVSVVLCILAMLGILYKFLAPNFGPKVQIILEPDYSLVSTIDPSDLETVVQILTARCRSFGFSGVSFAVDENNQIIVQVPASVDVEAFLDVMTQIGLLELVDFGEMPIQPGTRIATDFNSEFFPQVEGAKWHTVMTNNEFESVDVSLDQVGGPAISFTLTSSGTKILSDHTTENVGSYLGIVFDTVVISSPQVNAPITDGMGIIQGSFTPEEAESLAIYLKTKTPLPVPLIVKDVSIIDN